MKNVIFVCAFVYVAQTLVVIKEGVETRIGWPLSYVNARINMRSTALASNILSKGIINVCRRRIDINSRRIGTTTCTSNQWSTVYIKRAFSGF